MVLSDYVNTYGQYLLKKYSQRVHKISLDASFTCPNRDGTKGVGGCIFCNNSSFSPNSKQPDDLSVQVQRGKDVIIKRTGAKKYIGYFQAYTNTYDDESRLKILYDKVLAMNDIIGLSIGTRPDCVSDKVLDILQKYQDEGLEICLELGLQSSNDKTLEKINRGHGFYEYQQTAKKALKRKIPICTHLIIGLPDEDYQQNQKSLGDVLDIGTNGLKLHPLHVVKNTVLANQYKQGLYRPLTECQYIEYAANLIKQTPKDIIFHRVTGTVNKEILMAPIWCQKKWDIINGITKQLSLIL
ncbi:MAG: TIGR01212 family radical SAM protein [Gammaproteobacteria bacterium]|nr:MAG: TIGR01212 family radical SAM protein [Gammaproteobacteria bacterium]